MSIYEDRSFDIDNPPLKGQAGDEAFTSALTTEDRKAMAKYKDGVVKETLALTGNEVRERLARLNAEIRRIELVKTQAIRLKTLTRKALFTEVEND